MDEKTEELRDLFVNVTNAETVTEAQEEQRGSLTGDGGVDEQLEGIVARMRERYEFRTDLSDGDLRRVVRGYFGDDSDTAIADALGVSRRTVVRARLDLHLFRESDTDAPFDLKTFEDALESEESTADLATAFDVSESTVRRYRAVVEARAEAERVSHRFRREFKDALPDTALATRHAAHVREDGLDEATEGMENNLQL